MVFRGYPNHYKGNKFKEDTNVNHLRHRKSQVIKSYTPFQITKKNKTHSEPSCHVNPLDRTKPGKLEETEQNPVQQSKPIEKFLFRGYPNRYKDNKS